MFNGIIPPLVTLETADDLKAYLASPRTDYAHYKYGIKSQFVIQVIQDLRTSGKYAYNTAVMREVESRLGIEKQEDNGSTLAHLVFDNQRYADEVKYLAAGYKPLTQEMIEIAFSSHMKIEVYAEALIRAYDGNTGEALHSDTHLFSPRMHGSKILAFAKRSRTKYVIPQGQPAKIV